MKTFKQLMEELPKPVTPKQMDVIKKENQKFRSLYPFPSSFLQTAKKKSDKNIKTA